MPTDLPRPAVQTFRGNTNHMQLDPGLSERLGRLAQEQGVTLYMLLLAAFKVLLHRLSGQTDLLVGSAMSGRNHPQLEHLIGYFINPVALRTKLSGELGLDELLQRVRQTVLEAFDHQDYPPALLAEHLGVQRDPSRPPLFSATFIFQKAQLEDFGDLNMVALGMPGAELEMGDVRLASLELKGTPSQFDLTLMMADTPRGLAAAMIYNADLFLPETMDRWLGQLRKILEGFCASPQQKIFSLPFLPKQERALLLRWNRTRADYPASVTLQTLFEAQVRRTPHAEALRFGSLSISYEELNRRANRLAHFLRARGVGPECLVGLYLQRSIEMVVAIYAVIKAGAAYVPFDPTYPTDRVAFMLQDTAVPIILSTSDLRAPISSQSDSPAEIFCLDTQWEELAGFAADNPPVSAKPGNLAYVIFTSGSTGQPKGVMNEHAGICNRLLWMQSEYQLSGRDRVLQKTPYSFDVSVWEFFWPLQVGACLVIARPEGHKDADYLVETIASESITTLHFVPSMLQSFLGHEDVERCVSIRQVFCSGEALPYDLQERFFARLNCRLHNLYGPTEAAVDVTYWACQDEDARKIVPIGRPIANTRMYILDRRGRRLPIGAAGELFIGGIQVARGYLNRPALTAEKFLPDPFAEEADPRSGSRSGPPDSYSRPGRLYRTGDLARFLPDGSIEFLGRADFQVKVRGFRIELGEIEAALVSHAVVREAVVVASGDGEDRHLVAYYVPINGPEKPSHSELIRYLKQRLPEYMLPAVLVDLEGLPLSPNGKVDRRALPAPSRIRPELTEAYVAPRSPLEIELAEMCAQLLDLDRVGVFDDFFALGGSSLQATRLLYRARERFGQPVSLRRLFETPTVAGLADLLEGMRADGAGSAANGQGLRPAVSQQQLLEDVRLPADFQIDGSSGLAARIEQPREVFLTGATGFLGAYLAKDLLETTDARLHCLVRAESEESALRRVIGNLERYGLWKQDWTERIAVHCGDLGQKDLGMTAARFGELAGRIEVIFHNGASVNFIASYQALRSINVGGTQEILRLACMGQIKPVHFVSTLGIFNTDVPDDGSPIPEEGYPDHLGIPLSGYTQSKWVADRVIDLARSRGAPVSIYRPGVISGDSQTGAWNHADMVSGLIAASAAVGMLPDLDLPVDLAPVDYVSRAIVHLALHRDRVGSVYHLANPQPLPYAELSRWFEQIGFPVRVVSFAEWRAGLNEMAADQAGAVEWQIYLPLLEEIAEEQVFLPKIDCQNALRGLRGSEIICPAVDAGLLETYYTNFFMAE